MHPYGEAHYHVERPHEAVKQGPPQAGESPSPWSKTPRHKGSQPDVLQLDSREQNGKAILPVRVKKELNLDKPMITKLILVKKGLYKKIYVLDLKQIPEKTEKYKFS